MLHYLQLAQNNDAYVSAIHTYTPPLSSVRGARMSDDKSVIPACNALIYALIYVIDVLFNAWMHVGNALILALNN